MSDTGSSTGDETNSDVSLNDISANHNNNLFAGAVAETCVDALAHLQITADACDAEELNPLKGRPKEEEERDTEYLLADNSDYQAPVSYETANLWNKAITTLAKGKASNKAKPRASAGRKGVDVEERDADQGRIKGGLSAYDMSHILDGSIHGGDMPDKNEDQANGRKSKVVPSSEFSIDGESAILWGDEPEKAYFAYMLEKEAEARALEGKDQDDSLMAESTRRELLRGAARGTSSLGEEDDTTLGNPSKVIGGWDPSTVAGPSIQISSLTPSSQKVDAEGRLIIPNVIYVQDDLCPDPRVYRRTWEGQEKEHEKRRSSQSRDKQPPEQARESRSPRQLGNKSKAAEELGIAIKTLYNKLNQQEAERKAA